MIPRRSSKPEHAHGEIAHHQIRVRNRYRKFLGDTGSLAQASPAPPPSAYISENQFSPRFSSRPGSALKRREEFPHVLLSFRSIYAQSNSWKKALRPPMRSPPLPPKGRFPMKTVAEAIGVRAHVSCHTFAVPHPATIIRTSEHCHVFFELRNLRTRDCRRSALHR